MKVAIASALFWVVFLAVLTGALLWHFPWRGKEAQEAERLLADARVTRDALLQAVRQARERAKTDPVQQMYYERFGKDKSEEQEVMEFERSLKKDRDTFRRMPCWRAEGVKDELVMNQTEGNETTTFSFSFAAPVRAWDRFRLEILAGIAAGITGQVIALVTLSLLRKRVRRRQEQAAS